jgi:hypothetical protein
MHNAEHLPLGLWPPLRLIESDTVDGCNLVVINRAEYREQGGDALDLPRVLIAPWASGMKSQNRASKTGGKIEGARPQILLGCRAARLNALAPKFLGAHNAEKVILGPNAGLCLAVNRHLVEPLRLVWSPVSFVARLPSRKAKAIADMIASRNRIVAAERVDNEAISRAGHEAHR